MASDKITKLGLKWEPHYRSRKDGKMVPCAHVAKVGAGLRVTVYEEDGTWFARLDDVGLEGICNTWECDASDACVSVEDVLRELRDILNVWFPLPVVTKARTR